MLRSPPARTDSDGHRDRSGGGRAQRPPPHGQQRDAHHTGLVGVPQAPGRAERRRQAAGPPQWGRPRCLGARFPPKPRAS
eukprot:scaffold648300_cov46-Prasinocladus_malaysianus.AAC.1